MWLTPGIFLQLHTGLCSSHYHRQKDPSVECCCQKGNLKDSDVFSDRACWFIELNFAPPEVFPVSANDTLSFYLLRPESLESPLTPLSPTHMGFLSK